MGKIIPVEDRTDHLGNIFESEKDMCNYWNIKYETYKSRINRGWSIEEALTTPIKAKHYNETKTDHLGNIFESEKDMCEYWDINYETYRARIKSGLTKEKALITPITITSTENYTDHEGTMFKNIKDMCKCWNISRSTYIKRINKGYSKEEALGVIPLIGPRIKNIQFTDNLSIIRYVYSSDNIRYFECKFKDNKNEILSKDEILKIWRDNNKGGE